MYRHEEKITEHTKKQESDPYMGGKKAGTETICERVQMWDLTDNNVKNKSFKTAIINMLKRLHEITLKEVKDSMKQCLSKQG